MDRKLNAWANNNMAAVLGGFAAVAAVNTLVMTVLELPHLLDFARARGGPAGRPRGRIALGTSIAPATLVPMMNGLTGQGPYIPPLVHGSLAGTVVALGLAAAALPARAALRGETLEA